MTDLASRIDPDRGTLSGGTLTERRLSQLREVFVDQRALQTMLARGEDPVVYTVSTLEHGSADGDLHVGLGVLFPGRVGQEYFLTKGHRHLRAEAAEVYLGLRGTGKMILQDGSGTAVVDLLPNGTVYVPGHADHRTVNTGEEPLVYLGIYPAWAGHDYDALREHPFSVVILEEGCTSVIRSRAEVVASFDRHR